MDRERLILVFKMCALAVEMGEGRDEPLAELAAQFGAAFGVTPEEALQVLPMTLEQIADYRR